MKRYSTPEGIIGVGDLVVVYRVCCDAKARKVLGLVARVRGVEHFNSPCADCGATFSGRVLLDHHTYDAPPEHVKRIPPLSELEGQRTEEDLREPA